MLRQTFLHLPGIGRVREVELWKKGFLCWEDLLSNGRGLIGEAAFRTLEESMQQVENPGFFASRLPVSEHWRLFPAFRSHTACVDIETDGLGRENRITTVAVFDGNRVHTFIRNRNLSDLRSLLASFQLLITFNGSGFDLPFLSRELSVPAPVVHLDLMHIFRSLGIRGGLKKIENFFGLDRGDLGGVDGFCAVLFWKEYQERKDESALETLLAYNAEDVIHLETLMVHAYNRKIESLKAPVPGEALPRVTGNPFHPDEALVRNILRLRASTF